MPSRAERTKPNGASPPSTEQAVNDELVAPCTKPAESTIASSTEQAVNADSAATPTKPPVRAPRTTPVKEQSVATTPVPSATNPPAGASSDNATTVAFAVQFVKVTPFALPANTAAPLTLETEPSSVRLQNTAPFVTTSNRAASLTKLLIANPLPLNSPLKVEGCSGSPEAKDAPSQSMSLWRLSEEPA